MKRLVTVLGIIGLVVTGFSAQPAPASAASDLVTVKGHVRAPDGRGLAGILVKVRGKARTASQYTSATVRTSSTGRYEVRVPRTSGELVGYQISASDPGGAGEVATGGKWAPLYRLVQTDAAPVVRDLRLTVGAGLSGRLTDAAGRPVKKGLAMTAWLRTKEFPLGQRSATTRTTAGGRYRFTNLAAGPTTLCFQEIRALEYGRCYTGAPGGSVGPSKAKRLTLLGGTVLRGVDFEYPKVAGGIAGRVLLDGEAIDSDEHFAYVDLLDAKGALLDTVTTYSGFEFRELRAGTYYLRVHGGGDLGEELGSEYYRDAETLARATPIVHRRGQNRTDLVLDLTSDQPER